MAFKGRKGRRGGSALEFALFAPWYIFLFVGAFDWGFFAHALISTQNAARVGALYNAQMNRPNDAATACTYALREMRAANNLPSTVTTCDSLPLIVTAQQVIGPDGAFAAEVGVQYQIQRLIPIPGLLDAQYTFYRAVRMKI